MSTKPKNPPPPEVMKMAKLLEPYIIKCINENKLSISTDYTWDGVEFTTPEGKRVKVVVTIEEKKSNIKL